MNRIAFWLLCTVGTACCILAEAIVESMMSTDPSARAWMTFLPFIVPLLIMEALMYVIPVACVVELIVWIKKR